MLKGSVIVFVTAGYSGKRFIFQKAKELGLRSVVLDGPDRCARTRCSCARCGAQWCGAQWRGIPRLALCDASVNHTRPVLSWLQLVLLLAPVLVCNAEDEQ